jgi:hypothetical protein
MSDEEEKKSWMTQDHDKLRTCCACLLLVVMNFS